MKTDHPPTPSSAPDPAADTGGKRPPRKPRFSRDEPEVRRAKLVAAAIRCLAEGGMAAFRIERICAEAKVSRGLVNHYFPSKTDLLVAVYRKVLYDDFNFEVASLTRGDGAALMDPTARLDGLLAAMLAPSYFDAGHPVVWLALWGEIAVNPALKAAHRTLYQGYRSALADAMTAVAETRGRSIDGDTAARNLIALVDGLSLEWALDPQAFGPDDIRAAAEEFLSHAVGPRPG